MSLFVPIEEHKDPRKYSLTRYVNVDEIEYFVASSTAQDTTVYCLRSGRCFAVDCDIKTFADILNDYIKSYPDGGVADV